MWLTSKVWNNVIKVLRVILFLARITNFFFTYLSVEPFNPFCIFVFTISNTLFLESSNQLIDLIILNDSSPKKCKFVSVKILLSSCSECKFELFVKQRHEYERFSNRCFRSRYAKVSPNPQTSVSRTPRLQHPRVGNDRFRDRSIAYDRWHRSLGVRDARSRVQDTVPNGYRWSLLFCENIPTASVQRVTPSVPNTAAYFSFNPSCLCFPVFRQAPFNSLSFLFLLLLIQRRCHATALLHPFLPTKEVRSTIGKSSRTR